MSGKWYSSRPFANDLHKIEIAWLRKNKYLDGFKKGVIRWEDPYTWKIMEVGITVFLNDEQQFMELHYTQTDEYESKTALQYKIRLTTSPCNYGGQRYWFLCPLKGCGRRVGTLYLWGKYFGCRHCRHLTYFSQNESKRDKYNGWMAAQKWDERIDALEMKALDKRMFYAAKPTKFARKLRYTRMMSNRYSGYL